MSVVDMLSTTSRLLEKKKKKKKKCRIEESKNIWQFSNTASYLRALKCLTRDNLSFAVLWAPTDILFYFTLDSYGYLCKQKKIAT